MHFDQLFSNFTLYTTTGLVQGAIFALFALGYTLVYGVLRLINFAHSEVFMIGTFAAIEIWTSIGFTGASKLPGARPLVGLFLIGLRHRGARVRRNRPDRRVRRLPAVAPA